MCWNFEGVVGENSVEGGDSAFPAVKESLPVTK